MAIKVTVKKDDPEQKRKQQELLQQRQAALSGKLQEAEDVAAAAAVAAAKKEAEDNITALEQEAEERLNGLKEQRAEQQRLLDAQAEADAAEAAAAKEKAQGNVQALEEKAAEDKAKTDEQLEEARKALEAAEQDEQVKADARQQASDQLKALDDAIDAETNDMGKKLADAQQALLDADKVADTAKEDRKYIGYLELAARLNLAFGVNDSGEKSAATYLDSRFAAVSLACQVSASDEDASKYVVGVQADSKYYEMTDMQLSTLSDEKLNAQEAFTALSLARTGANFSNYPINIDDDSNDQNLAVYNKYLMYLAAKDMGDFTIENEDELKSLARYKATKDIAAQAKKDFDAFKGGDFYKGAKTNVDAAQLQSDLEAMKFKLASEFNASAAGNAPVPSQEAPQEPEADDADDVQDKDGLSGTFDDSSEGGEPESGDDSDAPSDDDEPEGPENDGDKPKDPNGPV